MDIRHLLMGLKHPSVAVNYFLRKRHMPTLLGCEREDIHSAYKELFSSKLFSDAKRLLKEVGFPHIDKKRQLELYVICRIAKPQTVIETGIEYGISSTFVLGALEANGRGKLYSIGIRETLEDGRNVGWLVQRIVGNRAKWDILIGDSLEVLPKLMRDLDQVIYLSIIVNMHILQRFKSTKLLGLSFDLEVICFLMTPVETRLSYIFLKRLEGNLGGRREGTEFSRGKENSQ